MSERFGAVYESVEIIDEWAEAFKADKPQRVFVVHGDADVVPKFVADLENLGYTAHAPMYTEEYDLLTDKYFTKCEASLYGDTANRSFGLNNALMIAFAFAGAYHHIILMHSSVTMYKGGGHLFLGKSGTGKSTHSKGWLKYIEGTELLNDDNPALRYLPETDEVKVYGTPWSGKTPCYKNQSVPVRAVVRLEQYPENIIRRESTLPSFASVLSSTSTMIWDKASYKKICETISNIVRHVPTFYLKCLPDEAAVRMSSEAIDAYYKK